MVWGGMGWGGVGWGGVGWEGVGLVVQERGVCGGGGGEGRRMGSGGTLDELIGAWCGFQTNPVEKADSVLDSVLDSDLKVLVHLIGAWCMSRRFRWRTLSMGFTTALPKLLRSQLGNTRREKTESGVILRVGGE